MKYFFALLLVILFFSCDKKQEQTNNEQESKPLLSVVKEYSTIEPINISYKKDIEDWEELRAVDNFLSRFKKVSSKEILSNALELKGLVKSLRDSIKPALFNIPAFDARVNIFYNETLRLADMNSIPAIKADEVTKQTEKIIAAFSSVNAKVNSVLAKKRFQEGINVDVKFIGLDSTRIDSISKNSINEELLERSVHQRKVEYKNRH